MAQIIQGGLVGPTKGQMRMNQAQQLNQNLQEMNKFFELKRQFNENLKEEKRQFNVNDTWRNLLELAKSSPGGTLGDLFRGEEGQIAFRNYMKRKGATDEEIASFWDQIQKMSEVEVGRYGARLMEPDERPPNEKDVEPQPPEPLPPEPTPEGEDPSQIGKDPSSLVDDGSIKRPVRGSDDSTLVPELAPVPQIQPSNSVSFPKAAEPAGETLEVVEPERVSLHPDTPVETKDTSEEVPVTTGSDPRGDAEVREKDRIVESVRRAALDPVQSEVDRMILNNPMDEEEKRQVTTRNNDAIYRMVRQKLLQNDIPATKENIEAELQRHAKAADARDELLDTIAGGTYSSGSSDDVIESQALYNKVTAKEEEEQQIGYAALPWERARRLSGRPSKYQVFGEAGEVSSGKAAQDFSATIGTQRAEETNERRTGRVEEAGQRELQQIDANVGQYGLSIGDFQNGGKGPLSREQRLKTRVDSTLDTLFEQMSSDESIKRSPSSATGLARAFGRLKNMITPDDPKALESALHYVESLRWNPDENHLEVDLLGRRQYIKTSVEVITKSLRRLYPDDNE